MFDWLKAKASGWKAPEPIGPSVLIRAFGSLDTPIAKSAEWHGNELEVRSDGAAMKSLFDVSLPDVGCCLNSVWLKRAAA